MRCVRNFCRGWRYDEFSDSSVRLYGQGQPLANSSVSPVSKSDKSVKAAKAVDGNHPPILRIRAPSSLIEACPGAPYTTSRAAALLPPGSAPVNLLPECNRNADDDRLRRSQSESSASSNLNEVYESEASRESDDSVCVNSANLNSTISKSTFTIV